jgi:hypothetical protein
MPIFGNFMHILNDYIRLITVCNKDSMRPCTTTFIYVALFKNVIQKNELYIKDKIFLFHYGSLSSDRILKIHFGKY